MFIKINKDNNIKLIRLIVYYITVVLACYDIDNRIVLAASVVLYYNKKIIIK